MVTLAKAEVPRSPGRLEASLRRGHFAVTAETTPPDSADPAVVLARVAPLRHVVDAVNVTDGAGARAHMSALACAAVLARDGIEPVLQFTVRDRNRLALQGDLIGAATLGVPNVLCLHGDHPDAGDQPEATAVYDLDSRGLLSAASSLRAGAFPHGRRLGTAPRLFVGAADTPNDPGNGWRPNGLLAKIEAGADFVQTQYCFDASVLRRYMTALHEAGVTERVFVLVGLGPLTSARRARWMNERLFGVHVPEAVIARLDGAADQRAEGRRICAELFGEVREMPGVAGVHFMAPGQEATVAELVEESGILAERKASA